MEDVSGWGDVSGIFPPFFSSLGWFSVDVAIGSG